MSVPRKEPYDELPDGFLNIIPEVSVSCEVIRVCGPAAAIFLGFVHQASLWMAGHDGFVSLGQADIELALGLGADAQLSARRRLTEAGWLEEVVRGNPPKLHYKVAP